MLLYLSWLKGSFVLLLYRFLQILDNLINDMVNMGSAFERDYIIYERNLSELPLRYQSRHLPSLILAFRLFNYPCGIFFIEIQIYILLESFHIEFFPIQVNFNMFS